MNPEVQVSSLSGGATAGGKQAVSFGNPSENLTGNPSGIPLESQWDTKWDPSGAHWEKFLGSQWENLFPGGISRHYPSDNFDMFVYLLTIYLPCIQYDHDNWQLSLFKSR